MNHKCKCSCESSVDQSNRPDSKPNHSSNMMPTGAVLPPADKSQKLTDGSHQPVGSNSTIPDIRSYTYQGIRISDDEAHEIMEVLDLWGVEDSGNEDVYPQLLEE